MCPNAENPTDPLFETPLEKLQLVPRWWHRLESIAPR